MSSPMASPGGGGGGSGPKLFGCVVMTLSGEPLWQGWLFKPSAKLSTKPLCAAVALVLGKRGGQDSSFITTGPYAVSSVRDGDYIVSIVCSSTCPEPEMLMKSKEVAHNVKLLLGTEQVLLGSAHACNCKEKKLHALRARPHQQRRATPCANLLPCHNDAWAWCWPGGEGWPGVLAPLG